MNEEVIKMRTVVALFDRFEEGQRAIRALTDQGYPNSEINLIVSDEKGEYSRQLGDLGDSGVETTDATDGAAAGAGIGAVLGGIGGLLLGLGALAIPGIGPVVAAGPIVATLAGAGVGAVAGGLIGALVDLGIPEEHAEYYAEGVRRGGTLVTVRTEDARAEDVRSLLNRYNPVDIETRSQSWRDEGWTGFEAGDTSMQYERDRSTSMPVTGVDRDVTEMERDDVYDVSDLDDRTRDDIFGTERAGRNVDMPVTGGGMSDMTGTTSTMGMGTGFAGEDWDMYDQTFRSDYQTRYGLSGFGYDYYQPAYRYGFDLSREERFRGYDWDRLEPEARRDWESRGIGGAWDDVKDAVRHAWERVTR
jgi:uncharacterized membrane protein